MSQMMEIKPKTGIIINIMPASSDSFASADLRNRIERKEIIIISKDSRMDRTIMLIFKRRLRITSFRRPTATHRNVGVFKVVPYECSIISTSVHNK